MKDRHKPITPDLRAFLNELADLLEKHRVTIAPVEGRGHYETFVDGIEFEQDRIYDADSDRCIRMWSVANFDTGTSSIDAARLRELTAKTPTKAD